MSFAIIHTHIFAHRIVWSQTEWKDCAVFSALTLFLFFATLNHGWFLLLVFHHTTEASWRIQLSLHQSPWLVLSYNLLCGAATCTYSPVTGLYIQLYLYYNPWKISIELIVWLLKLLLELLTIVIFAMIYFVFIFLIHFTWIYLCKCLFSLWCERVISCFYAFTVDYFFICP